MRRNKLNAAVDMRENNDRKLVRVNDELAVSPRVYRLIRLAARTAWDDSPDWFIDAHLEGILQEIREDLHVYTRCVRRGITRREYEDEQLNKAMQSMGMK